MVLAIRRCESASTCAYCTSVPTRAYHFLHTPDVVLHENMSQCCLHVSSAVELPVSNTIADSLHKTFTDCYHAPGFTGGYWGTATNDNKMNYYYLGWETREVYPLIQSLIL